MDFRLTPEQEAWRQEIRAFIKANITPELQKELDIGLIDKMGPASKEFIKKLANKKWLGVNWPKEYGGLGRSVLDYLIFTEEIMYYQVPFPIFGMTMVGPTILRVGNEEQKQQWIPQILSGDIEFIMGYSEPDAGTDLANLKCRAALDGDEWVISGQKIWNSAAHYGTHEWLTVRTDPNVPKHKGISVVIVPMDRPGITVRPLWTLGEGRTNETFFDNVRVPRQNLIGEVNRGWYYVAMALDFERVAIGPVSPLMRILSEMIRYCKETRCNGKTLAEDPIVRHHLAEMAVDIEVCRMLNYRTAWMIEKGLVPNMEASMLKIFQSEALARHADIAMQIQGLYGQLNKDSKWAPLRGLAESAYRGAPVGRFGGGTNEIQRNIMAQRGLGLPRS